MSPSMHAAAKRVFEEEILRQRTEWTAREWFEAKERNTYNRDACHWCGDSGRELGDWSLPCRSCERSERSESRSLNGYDARALAVLKVLLETDVQIVNPTMTNRVESVACEDGRGIWSLHHDALWVISFASCVETRELQVVATSWGNRHHPRPGQHYRRSPVVILIAGRSIPDWLDEFTY